MVLKLRTVPVRVPLEDRKVIISNVEMLSVYHSRPGLVAFLNDILEQRNHRLKGDITWEFQKETGCTMHSFLASSGLGAVAESRCASALQMVLPFPVVCVVEKVMRPLSLLPGFRRCEALGQLGQDEPASG